MIFSTHCDQLRRGFDVVVGGATGRVFLFNLPATRLAQLRDRLSLLRAQLDAFLAQDLSRRRDRLNLAALRLSRRVPRTERRRGHIGLLAQRLDTACREQHMKRLGTLDKIAAALFHLNPEATLARGFSIVRDSDGRLVMNAGALHDGQTVSLYLASGTAEASILSTTTQHPAIAT